MASCPDSRVYSAPGWMPTGLRGLPVLGCDVATTQLLLLSSSSPQALSPAQRLAVPGVLEPVPEFVPVRRAEDVPTRGRVGRGMQSLYPSKGHVSPVP